MAVRDWPPGAPAGTRAPRVCIRQMLKCDEKFLYGLLTLSQEQSIKTGRFAMIYADKCIRYLPTWRWDHIS